MQQTFQCYRCGAQNYVGQPYCWNCQSPFQWNCSRCGFAISNVYQNCPNCGTPTPWRQPLSVQQQPNYQYQKYTKNSDIQNPSIKTSKWLSIIIGIIVVGAMLAIYLNSLGVSTSHSEYLQITNDQLVKSNSCIKVTGIAKNITSKNILAVIDVKYYDSQGTLIGTDIAYTETLGPGEAWNFETTGVGGEKAAKITRYQISTQQSRIR